MSELVVYSGESLAIDKKSLFRDFTNFNPSEIKKYEDLLTEILPILEPRVLFLFSDITEGTACSPLRIGQSVVFVLITIGGAICERSDTHFKNGSYLKGTLIDRMGDFFLTALEEKTTELLREECRKRHVGVSDRMESGAELPISYQKVIFDVLGAKEQLGMDITDGFMLKPVKSSEYVLLLTEDEAVFQAEHDCRKCLREKCDMCNVQSYQLEIMEQDGTRHSVLCSSKQTLWDALWKAGISVPAVCGGTGRCGKCKIQVLNCTLPVSQADQTFLSESEIQEGYRLACTAYPNQDSEVILKWEKENSMAILLGQNGKEADKNAKEELFIAIDMGTTTLAMELMGQESGVSYAQYSCANRQRVFGADVLSRIQAAVQGKLKELTTLIRGDIEKGISNLIAEGQVMSDRITQVVITGNTTMVHLLMGYRCDTLGVYPFTPVTLETIQCPSAQLFHSELKNARVTVLPVISTFVGGDITAGMYACGFEKEDSISILVDLGTNGEIAIGNRKKIIVSSVAAGPAFEGGSLLWGTAGIAGAICGASYRAGNFFVRTIGDKPPIGICGTGALEIVAELLRNGIIDRTGLLCDPYFETGVPISGEIIFTQKDIREIQMAKAAIRAGIEILLRHYGADYDQIEHVFIGGGFGHEIDCQKMTEIGLFPPELTEKISPSGNLALSGAIKYAVEDKGEEVLQKILSVSNEILLSQDVQFNSRYIKYMMFE